VSANGKLPSIESGAWDQIRGSGRVTASARDWAMQLGLTEHAATLQATLDEEKHADQLLSQISQRANRDASTVAA